MDNSKNENWFKLAVTMTALFGTYITTDMIFKI